MLIDKYKVYSWVLVRWGVGVVFFLFGLDQVLNPENWFSWMPLWMGNMGFSLMSLITILGILNLIAGSLILVGWKVRWGAGYALLHLSGVVFTIGGGDILIRDLGLLLIVLGVFLSEGDNRFCLGIKN